MKKFVLYLFSTICFMHFISAQNLISEGKPAFASSVEGGNIALHGNDGKSNTRWGSDHANDQNKDEAWWIVDLEGEYHISKVEFDWETAHAKEYAIDISNDFNFNEFVEIAHVSNSQGGNETVLTDNSQKARYLRFRAISRASGYGYSFWECRVFGTHELVAVPVSIEIPYVQYLKLSLSPADLNGISEITVQNTDKTIDFSYNQGTPLSISLLDFRGDYSVDLWTLKEGSENDSIKGIPLNTVVYPNMLVHLKLTAKITFGNQSPVADAGSDKIIYSPENSVELDGSRSIDADGEIVSFLWQQINGPSEVAILNPDADKTIVNNLTLGEYKFRLTVTDDSLDIGTDEVLVSVLPPEQIDFNLLLPLDKSMISDTRTPLLSWEALPDAEKYEVFLNISRNDYEWHASGNLLDRYTKIGETNTNSFTVPIELVDRWTYKWYVIATTKSGTKYSDRQQFGLYIPYIEQENDGVGIVDGCRDLNKNGTIDAYENWRLTPEERLDDLMERLTTEEKISQLFYGGNDNPLDGFAFSYGVEGGMRENQYKASKARMGIPIAFLGDKAHGWKTIYPTQLGLAATRDMDLVFQCGNLHRIEQKSFGFTGTLAPVAEVNTKVLYPRIQEGCGENADEAAAMIRALVCGMQGGPEVNPHSMMVTIKHWPSQGAGGESVLQYDDISIKYHMKPWHAAVDANAVSVMPGYNTCPYLDPMNGANSSKKVIDYLRNEIKFKGFVVTDWLAANTAQSVESINAGIEVMGGAPSSYTDFEELLQAVGIERINEAVRRVLDIKIRMGMFENPYADPSCTWTNQKHHNIVLDAARKSITLLKNDNILPLKMQKTDQLLVAGPRAVWGFQEDPNVIWQSIYYDNPQAKTYLQAITDRADKEGLTVYHNESENPDVAIVVIGERAYTHGTEWNDKNPNIPEEQLSIIRDFHEAGVKVITVILMPRPYVLTPLVEISDAILVVYRGGNGIAQALAECLFGDFAPSGKLPFQLPRSIEQIGTDNVNNQIEKWDLPYDLGANDAERILIRNYIDQGLNVPPVFGDPLFQYGYGIQGFGVEDTTPSLEFDLLSPEDGLETSSNSITFLWEAGSDPESSISHYELYIDDIKHTQTSATTFTTTLSESGTHSWYVLAVNGAGLERKSKSTRTFSLKASSLEKLENDILINIYPNPANEFLMIDLRAVENLQYIELFDFTGNLILRKKLDAQILNIDMSNNPSGVYFLRILTTYEQLNKKIIKH